MKKTIITVSEKEIRTELHKYVTAVDVRDFRLKAECIRSSTRTYANITDMQFIHSCKELPRISEEDLAHLGDNAYIGGVIRTADKLGIPGDRKVLCDVVALAAYHKISELSNRQFIDLTIKKVMEVAQLYTFA